MTDAQKEPVDNHESISAHETAAARKLLHPIPLRITDTTLRDAHQSLWATRMRTKDILGIIDTVDAAGFYSLEVWGGATFDTCLRFLRENPWERLRQIKARCKKTPLQMLLRGQNVLGYKNYPDDLLDRFIALSCQNGMDIFRVFDALNDTRNVEQAIKSVKKYGGHAQGTICYTISPMHTTKEFCRIAHELTAIGVDSICIKDMAGILTPISCRKLVTALIKEVNVPIQIHSHATSGMATATYVEGVVAGAGAIDCAISPMAGFSSQPPVETMLAIFEETYYRANLDIDALRKMCDYFIKLAPERRLSHHPDNIIDPEILVHHIPGGMISNLRSQLQQQNALNRLDEVLKELPLVRADLGYPPLVTPTSQIVGVQAVLNVLAGERYKMVTQETKDYVRGMYGRSPAAISSRIRKKILGDEKLITCRPADMLEPMLPQATTDVDPNLIKAEEDILSYCLFPEVALDYFRWRNLPVEERPTPPADIELMKEKKGKDKPASSEPPPPPQAFLSGDDYREIQGLLDKVHQLQFNEIVIRRNDLTLSLKAEGMAVQNEPGTTAAPAKPAAAPAKPVATAKPAAAPAPEKKEESGPSIKAPLNGTFYMSSGPGKPPFVKIGDTVKSGDPVCIVEAMKLFNQIKAPCNCKIVKALAEHGQAVTKDQALFLYEPA
jgi:oxaloacetate decarboxylase alpha subunit